MKGKEKGQSDGGLTNHGLTISKLMKVPSDRCVFASTFIDFYINPKYMGLLSKRMASVFQTFVIDLISVL